ncbi:hypothetical protein MBLNU13_g10166t1 [Cladosporium sp. NU13]
MRSTRASQPIYDDASDGIEPIAMPKKQASRKKQTPTQPKEIVSDHSPPAPRYNIRSRQIRSPESSEEVTSDDEEGAEELPSWPRYKDDLPNAFNGDVDPSLDFISKAPVEIIDNILSFLVLDHDPERGVKMREGNSKGHYHVLISMSAMSQLFYHATEAFAHKFLTMNQEALSVPSYAHYWRDDPEVLQRITANMEEYERARGERERRLRRSSRIANQPKEEPREVHRIKLCRTLQSKCAICMKHAYTPGKFANAVSICSVCESSVNGTFMTLTDALKTYDLRDYMLMKSRKPGPRAKFTDLPAIPYGSEYKALGFPVFKTITVFYFRLEDLRRIADLVHGDWIKHMSLKRVERAARQERTRTKRVRKFIIEYHERELETSKGKVAKRHQKRLNKLRSLAPDEPENGASSRFGCTKHYCYHNVGLCEDCGDIPGRNREDCDYCDSVYTERRYDEFWSHLVPDAVSNPSNA